MNRKELIGRVCDTLRANNIRKPISINKNTFYITDSGGESAEFTVKRRDKDVIYTVDDVSNILDAFFAVVMDGLKNGEDTSIRNFGTFTLKRHIARRTKDPQGNWHDVPAWHAPKFVPGKNLWVAAKLYQLDAEPDNAGGDG